MSQPDDLRPIPDEGDDFLRAIRESWAAYEDFVSSVPSVPLPDGETWSSAFASLGEAIVKGLVKGLAEGVEQ